MIGQLLADRYQIVQSTGSGTYGESYLALDTYRPGYPRCVVKKLQPLSDGPKTPQMIKLLLKTKIKILAKLGRSDYVPAILDFFEAEQDLYIVEEFILGYPLSQEIVPDRPWTEDQVIHLLQGMLDILVFVHGQGVIHQDIQPANIIRRQPVGQFMLTNFSLVREVSTPGVDSHRRFKHCPVLDAPAYKAPEQFQSHPLPSSDIYALGMIAIQALTGLSAAELSGLKRANGSDTREIIWQRQAQVSQALSTVIDRMVRQNFRQRYQEATEVLQDLQQSGAIHKAPAPPAKSSPGNPPAIAVPQVSQKPVPPMPSTLRQPSSMNGLTPPSEDLIEAEPLGFASTPLNDANSSTLSADLSSPPPAPTWRSKLPLILLGSLALLALGGLAYTLRHQTPQEIFASYSLNQGNTKREGKDYEGAIAEFDRAIELNANDSQAYFDRGVAFYEKGNAQRAVEDFTQVLRLDPKNAAAFYYRGETRLKLGDRQGALDDLNQSVQLDPNSARTYQSRGNTHAEMGNEQAAVEDYTRAIQADPNLAPAYLNRCLSHSNLNNQARAIEDCSKAISLKPNYAFAYQNRGLAHRRNEDFQKALEDLNVAIRLIPNDADPYYNRGLARMDMGDRKGAIEDYNTAIRLNPTHTLVYYDRGVARAADGDRTGAIEDFQQAAKLCLDQGRTACYKDAQYQLQKLQKPTPSKPERSSSS